MCGLSLLHTELAKQQDMVADIKEKWSFRTDRPSDVEEKHVWLIWLLEKAVRAEVTTGGNTRLRECITDLACGLH